MTISDPKKCLKVRGKDGDENIKIIEALDG
jgi:hypothetical protein